MLGDRMLPLSVWRTSKNTRLCTDGLHITWSHPYTSERSQENTDTQIASEFAALGAPGTGADTFVKFGKTYGPLLLCSHGLPRSHIDVRQREYIDLAVVEDHDIAHAYRALEIVEPIATWREFAVQAATAIDVSERLRRNQPGLAEQWQILMPHLPKIEMVDGTPYLPTDDSIEVQRYALALFVQKWLLWGAVEVTYAWPNGEKAPTTRVGANTLFGSIALGLALTLARGGEFLVCEGCKNLFSPKRRRDLSKKTWCGDPSCQLLRKKLELREFRAREKATRAAPKLGRSR